MLGYWFLVQVLSGITRAGMGGGGVAFWAHVGGFVAGSVLIWAFRDKELLDRHPFHGWNPRGQQAYWRRIDRR
jgi:membrane associated rhomboid family serine protease